MPTIILAKTSDIPPGNMKTIATDSKKILLANIDGTFHAIGAACPHMGVDLSTGTLVGCIVTCPRHGAAFDVTDGQPIQPADKPPMKRKGAVAWPVWIENDQVMMED